ncbi:MAG TPA: IPT/TIG domain-containing protein, partial [Gammaproteobacteria bacterium]
MTRKPDRTLEAGTTYYVQIDGSLAALAEQKLGTDFQFAFYTSIAGALSAPNIVSVTPASGGIDGGTPIVVRGLNFGSTPQLRLGQQPLVIDQIEAPTPADPYEKIHARTVPNFAGPAAVEVINDAGLKDIVIGAFTYVDILQISYINPGIVRIDQSGEGDKVEIVGYGFHDKVKLRAWQTGDEDTAVEFTVDNNRLRLYSAEKMEWVVPDFGGDYRGYVDVEIRDQNNRVFRRTQALFYGQLQLNRRIPVLPPLQIGDIDKLQNGSASFIPDVMFLPPGQAIDIASDPVLGLIYALGEGLLAGGLDPDKIKTLEEFEQYFAPGWISLIRYERDAIEDAAPMHGLGYFNLPQDLIPRTMLLGKTQLYVTADSYHFPFINTEHEDKRLLLVYDREDRPFGTGGEEQPESKDRDIIYKLELDFEKAPTILTAAGNLLFAGSKEDGVAVISIADPKKPSLVRRLRTAQISGKTVSLEPDALQVTGNHLLIMSLYGTAVFDISQPLLPQVGSLPMRGDAEIVAHSAVLVERASGYPRLYDVANPMFARVLGQYKPNGLELPGGILALATAPATMALGSYFSEPLEPADIERRQREALILAANQADELSVLLANIDRSGNYAALLDSSRPEQIGLLDAIRMPRNLAGILDDLQLTDDGLMIGYTTQGGYVQNDVLSEVTIMDTFVLDLVQSDPLHQQVGVPIGAPITLTFNRPIDIPFGSLAGIYLARYLSLIRDDGTAQGQPVDIDIDLDGDDSVITITPDNSLLANSSYRLVLSGEPASRRTRGLFNHEIRFTTATNNDPPPTINSVEPPMVNTTGGKIFVTVANANNPVFLLANENAPVIAHTALENNLTRYELEAASNFAGPAVLEIINSNGARDSLLGAVQFVEPLELISITPAQGSVNGGTRVVIKGRGFRPGENRVNVFFDDLPASINDIRVLDSETLLLVTPAARLGKADVIVKLDNGQSAVLEDGFDFQQPIQANITGGGSQHVYDLTLDPTGTFLITAQGSEGVVIYNINPSAFT